MKQTILYPGRDAIEWPRTPCLGRLAFLWAVYGYAMALFWWALPRSPLADAAAWAVAAACGLALAGSTAEV